MSVVGRIRTAAAAESPTARCKVNRYRAKVDSDIVVASNVFRGAHERIGNHRNRTRQCVRKCAGQFKLTTESSTCKEEEEMGMLTWIVVGLIAGFLAGMVMKGGGYGVLGDII